MRRLKREDWREENDSGRESLTQAIGRAAHAARIQGLLVPSSQLPKQTNLIVFPDRLAAGSRLEVDHAGRLH